ncbi:MAG: redoxin domain-containing protein [Phycisphaerales bacterium]|nr:redoxin domain-containing protein [Phycisphaerales bacterium]
MTRTLAIVLAAGATLLPCSTPSYANDAREKAAQVLRDMASNLESSPRLSFNYSIEWRTTAEGMLIVYTIDLEASRELPGKYALRRTGGTRSADFYSDGEQRYIYVRPTNRFVKEPANTEDVRLFSEDPSALGGFADMMVPPGLLAILSHEPHRSIQRIKGDAEYIGLEEVNGTEAHRIRTSLGGRKLEIWVDAGDSAWLLRTLYEQEPDESYTAWYPDIATTAITDFSNWQRINSFPENAFAFVPPDDAESAQSIVTAFWGDFGFDFDEDFDDHAMADDRDEFAHLIGARAPDFALHRFDGGEIRLSDAIKDHKAVVIDFWASWCPPCVAGLPVLKELTDAHDGDVAFIAINVREDEATIRRFLDRQGLELTVAMDTDGSVSRDYSVSGIPQTVIIGADGTVRSVHVGFAMNMKDDIRRDIDDAVEGRPLDQVGPAQPVSRTENLHEVWALQGRWGGVAADNNAGEVYAISRRGVTRVSPTGEPLGEIQLVSEGQTLRIARFNDAEAPSIVTFRQWGVAPVVFGADGAVRFRVPELDGVNDVIAADITGDGVDELLVGYNGNGGLRLFDHQGNQLWRTRHIGNVWSVTAADISGDGVRRPVSTSAGGTVHIFDESGNQTNLLRPPLYATLVHAIPTGANDELLLLGSAADASLQPIAARIAPDGEVRWTARLEPNGQHIRCSSVSPCGSLAAGVTTNGQLTILDLADGETVATIQTVFGAEFDWLARNGDSPLLVLASERGLQAFEVVREDPAD